MTRKNKRFPQMPIKCVVVWGGDLKRNDALRIASHECRKNAGHVGHHKCECGAVRTP